MGNEVWDLLGLDSCGAVFKDGGELAPIEDEIRIVVWEGLRDTVSKVLINV